MLGLAGGLWEGGEGVGVGGKPTLENRQQDI